MTNEPEYLESRRRHNETIGAICNSLASNKPVNLDAIGREIKDKVNQQINVPTREQALEALVVEVLFLIEKAYEYLDEPQSKCPPLYQARETLRKAIKP